MSRSDFEHFHTLHAIEAWAKVIDIQTQVGLNKGLIIKRLFSCQNYDWIIIQLNTNPIECAFSIPKGLSLCYISFVCLSVHYFICVSPYPSPPLFQVTI